MRGRPSKAKCELCGKSFKSTKYLNQHKCSVEAPKVEAPKVEAPKVEAQKAKPVEPKNKNYVVCPNCFKDIYKKNYARHNVICSSHDIVTKFLPAFLFVARLIKAYNNKIKQENYLGKGVEKKRLIYEYFAGEKEETTETKGAINSINLNEHRGLLGLKLTEKEAKEISKVEMYTKIKKIKNYPLKNIIETNNGFNPSISARQVIYEYLDSIKIYNEMLNKKIERTIGEDDFYTDVELFNFSPEFYVNVMRLRRTYEENYYKAFGEFLFKIKEVTENPEKFQCQWCLKYFKNLRQHVNKCKKFKENYDSFPHETIDRFLFTFYYNIEPEDYSAIDNYFNKRPCGDFLKNISYYIKNRIDFVKQEMKEKEKEEKVKQLLGKKRYGKKELISDIYRWVDDDEEIQEKPQRKKMKLKKIKKKRGDEVPILAEKSPVKEKKEEEIGKADLKDLIELNDKYIKSINLFNNCKFILNINKK